MSSDKSKRATRRNRNWLESRNQIRIYQYSVSNTWPISVPGKYRKHHANNCGRSHCMMCVNPRRTWNRRTLAEIVSDISFKQDLEEYREIPADNRSVAE